MIMSILNRPAMLSVKQCEEIQSLRSGGMSWKAIGQMFSVSERTAKRGYDWLQANNTPTPKATESKAVEESQQEDQESVVEPKQTTDSYAAVVASDTVTIVNKTTSDSVTIDPSHKNYDRVLDTIIAHIRDKDEQSRNSYFAMCYELASPKKFLEKIVNGRVVYDPQTNKVYDEQGVSLPDSLVNKILDVIEKAQETDVSSWMNFVAKLLENPSNRAVRELYGFIAAKDIEINEDGDVVCFKKIRSNFKDIHSNTFDNSVGKTVSVPRNMVNEDSNITCSYGLHVCSKSYLPYFGSASNDVVVKVIVNPKDFVSIPTDYNDAKARVCSYYVDSVVN